RIPDPPTRIRVTDFGGLLADPYRWVLERILNLDPLDDEAREMDGRAFGSLAHLVLERFGTSPEVASPDPEVVEKKLSRLLDGAVHERFGRHPVPAVRIQTEQLRVRLGRFARWQADRIAEGWRVMCVEQQPEPGVPFEVDGESILLRGKIDRIDHNEETGAWAVLDYKTGDDGKEPEEVHRKGRGAGRRWVDLQLPLYRRLLAGVLGEDGAPVVPEDRQGDVGLGYILLPKSLDGVGHAMAAWTADELAEAEETAKIVVRNLRRGAFSFDPKARSPWRDPFDALLGRTLLPVTPKGEDGGGE
ncbi:MAG: PD-(D/E)XK nuclease family protein, partial [Longimicrobiales bacterium]